MTSSAPVYDLMLLLDPEAQDTARAKVVADARTAIQAGGELARHDDWGTRPLAYPIGRRTAAEYHLLQFHPGRAELLGELDRSLRIADGILRFRLIKLKPGVPPAPDMRPVASPHAQAPAQPVTDAPAQPAAQASAPGSQAPGHVDGDGVAASEGQGAGGQAPAGGGGAPASEAAGEEGAEQALPAGESA
jgi:small subunit ribosomal protein S6